MQLGSGAKKIQESPWANRTPRPSIQAQPSDVEEPSSSRFYRHSRGVWYSEQEGCFVIGLLPGRPFRWMLVAHHHRQVILKDISEYCGSTSGKYRILPIVCLLHRLPCTKFENNGSSGDLLQHWAPYKQLVLRVWYCFDGSKWDDYKDDPWSLRKPCHVE